MYYIKGNEKRGVEVIALLESKGGRNYDEWLGTGEDGYYYVDFVTKRIEFINNEDGLHNREVANIKQYYTELTLPNEPKWEPKRGETVLVRRSDKFVWDEAVFSFSVSFDNIVYYHVVGGNSWKCCIPFDINKLGKVTED